jgi:hypothetical protein
MRVFPPLITGLVALAAVSAQAAPSANDGHWRSLGAVLSFDLGDHACGEGWHQPLRRDWRGDWWWGPCVPDWH